MAHQGFFERQASARRNTGLLVLLFLTAVALITLAVCAVAYFTTRSESSHLPFLDWLVSKHGLYTALAIVGVIIAGSLFRWMDLSGGGQRVAKMVGARPVDPATQDLEERRLRNVVEEMAIASGISVPDLYVMDRETGINAFVAGYSPGEAVMVVTHGTLTNLSRDELQGVVAHEFSHILNGDMRLNVRLIAILAGILMIGQIGTYLAQASFMRRRRYSSRDSRGQAAFGLVGLALMAIGYIGVFFGRLIQSAVSRQREMLADASSVQFTRNPEGIAGALFKIGAKGGFLDTTTHASDMNHMCFGEAARMQLSSLLASHPPIEKRIEAIGPGLLPRLRSRFRNMQPDESVRDTSPSDGSGQATSPMPEAAAGFSAATGAAQGQPSKGEPTETEKDTRRFSDSVGTANRASEEYAQALLKQLPSSFRGLLYTRAGAIQFCYALLISGLSTANQKQHLALIHAESIFSPNPDLLEKLLTALDNLGPGIRLPALELAMPALRKLDPEERHTLIDACETLIKADKRVSLFELTILSFLRKHLAGDAQAVVPVRHKSYRSVQKHLLVLFSLLARTGTDQPDQQQALLEEAMASFHSGKSRLPLLDKISLTQLRDALWHLNRLSPLLKPGILDASCHCVLADGEVKPREYEMIRLIADQMDCPMPPLQT
ncbi:M48 family metallopeptidase [Marinobacter sp. CHS3-4]|uniref:M48 family metallopeptidase n=1 Tax=Marinobacter sp. CHS3-4 TaxID=3045174 RepID=UPI0024B4D83F|nr:M48 family metallopeptidase [Marinobacter sp. CHS3-4]MDI9245032.1 M48 family metallopeptidase [Marinobacter sp. CHS3-4]